MKISNPYWPDLYIVNKINLVHFDLSQRTLSAGELSLLRPKGFSWDKDAKKLQQPIKIEGDERDDEDPTPKFTKAEYGDAWPESIPTVWTNPPKTRAAGTGRLQLVDQQQLTLGGDALFQFVKLDKDSITISTGKKEFEIPLNQVSNIEFPK